MSDFPSREAPGNGGAQAAHDDRDESDVPAAVLCASCGSPDCGGCESPEQRLPPAIPWEARSGTRLGRLWGTARLASLDGETFFGELGKGSVGTALAFATLCELCAIGSLLVVFVPFAYACVPELVTALMMDPETRVRAVALLGLSVPLLSGLMVLLHVIWGGTLELGVRLAGESAEPRHGLRYALYACGWDLLTSPFGLAAASLTSGPRRGLMDLRAAMRVPRAATRAYLARARGVADPSARTALVIAAVLTGALVTASAIVLGAGIVVAMI